MPEIIYRDRHYAAINKPHGLLTHPSSIAVDAGETAMQWLRNQLGQYVYPVHRLDRKTGGVLLFALDREIHRDTQKMFAENRVKKKYLAIVRGYADDEGVIDNPVKGGNGKVRGAVTHYKTLVRTEIAVPCGRHNTSRYSLVLAEPKTGRMHQLRMHFSHILHPIIGDRPHGCNKQNRLFKEQWQMNTMLLHAKRLVFRHPVEGTEIDITAPPQPEFQRMMDVLGLTLVS
jgi:tRNA pseudouridine65 synthase